MSAKEMIPVELPVGDIDPDPSQPRKTIEGLKVLAASITTLGIIQPIAVRPHPTASGRWMIIVGERRWRAAVIAGLKTIPAFSRADIADDRIFFMQIVENLDDYRHPLEAHEKAVALQQYVESIGVDKACEELGQKKDWISRETALAKVSDDIWDLAQKESIKDKRTILDLSRLCKHTGKDPQEEWKGIGQIGPAKRQALHARMEASGVKKKRQKGERDQTETGNAAADQEPGADASGPTPGGAGLQIVPKAPAPPSAGTSLQTPASGGRFQRKGLNSRVKKAGKVLGIDPDADFEKLLEELLRRAIPELVEEDETAVT
jgi:ParB family chromosome partitioning protein